jgi:hypothetical protein
MRKTSIYYTGPVVRLLNRTTTTEDDFYTDDQQTFFTNSSNVSVDTWSNGNTLYVTRWYDQSGNGNFLSEGQAAPIFAKHDNKYLVYFNNPNTIFTVSLYNLKFSTPINFKQFTSVLKPMQFGNDPSYLNNIVDGSIAYSNAVTNSPTTGRFVFTPSVVSSNVNNVITTTCNVQIWNTVTAYWGSPITNATLIGNTPSNIAITALNGYVFELGFFNGTTLSGTESNTYYAQRPSGF